jgi:hypothetical protein
VKRLVFLLGVVLTPLFSFDNHFIGVVASSGQLNGDSDNILADESFVTLGIKTGIITENVMVYMDYQHFTFEKKDVQIDGTETNFNEDMLSLAVGPVFKMENWFDTFFYVNAVAVVDKFHYSEEIVKDRYNKYLSQYQLFLGYELGLIFPLLLNPWHDETDSFLEIGYRQVYRNDSVLDSANSDSGLDNPDGTSPEPFSGMSQYYFGVNILF